jgi:hypothetical protein
LAINDGGSGTAAASAAAAAAAGRFDDDDESSAGHTVLEWSRANQGLHQRVYTRSHM